METIGNRLREARIEADFKQSAAAARLGFSRPTLSAIESGKRAVLAEEVPRFAELYHVSAEQILFGNGQPEKRGEKQMALEQTELMDYEEMKEKLSMEAVPVDRNQEMLSKVPHEKMEDIAIVYRFVITNDSDVKESVLVTNGLLNQMGVTPEQLKNDALENAPASRPAMIAGLSEVLSGMTGEAAAEFRGGEPEILFVATTQDQTHGSGVIAYPGFLDQAAQELQSDFYVLPSSIHEVLLLKDSGNLKADDLQQVVQDINRAEVLEQDQLSDHVYHYDSREHVFELAEHYEERIAEKAMDHDAGRDEAKASVLEGLHEKQDSVRSMPEHTAVREAGKHRQEAAL